MGHAQESRAIRAVPFRKATNQKGHGARKAEWGGTVQGRFVKSLPASPWWEVQSFPVMFALVAWGGENNTKEQCFRFGSGLIKRDHGNARRLSPR